jgi:hypothetical protein
MATIMLIVAVSRFFAIPKYLTQLQLLSLSDTLVQILTQVSFIIMCCALLVGAVIILTSLFRARRMEKIVVSNT